MYQVIFVLGGPGAGKGTQCALLSSRYDLVHLSAGDLLREERERAASSDIGRLINECIGEGKIVPMQITIGLLSAAMKASGKNAFLIDGFPRDIAQGVQFEIEVPSNTYTFKMIDFKVCEYVAMLFFDCPESELIDRLLQRGETSERIDDNAESIRKRMQTYRTQTMPVREWARSSGKLVEVDSSGPVNEVFEACCNALEAHGLVHIS